MSGPTRTRTLATALFMAALFAWIFSRSTYTDFEKIRIKIIDEPVAGSTDDGVFSFETVPEDRPKIQFLSLTCQSANSDSPRMEVFLNSELVGALNASNKAGETVFEFDGGTLLRRENKLRIKSESSQWILTKAEAKDMRAFSSGVLSFYLVKNDFTAYTSPSLVFATATLLSLFLLIFFSGFRSKGFLILKLFALVCLGAIYFIPWVSRWLFLISSSSFGLIVACVYFPELRYAVEVLHGKAKTRYSGIDYALKLVTVHIAIFGFVLLAFNFYRKDFVNYSSFLHLSERYIKQNPVLKDQQELKRNLVLVQDLSYDGQFMYIMAFDPFLTKLPSAREYRRVLDNPPYRYSRIGFPLLTILFSLNQPRYFPAVMIWLILISSLVSAFFLTRILAYFNRDPFWALLYLLIPGLLVSLRFGLPESVAGTFLLGGAWQALRKHSWAAACFFAAAILIRETSIVFLLCMLIPEIRKHTGLKPAVLAGALLPYLGWKLFLIQRLFSQYTWRTIYTAGNFSLPFVGIAGTWNAVFSGQYPLESSGIVFSILLVLAFALSLFLAWKFPGPLTFAALGYGFLSICFSYERVWLSIVNAERVTYEVFLCLILVFYSLPNTRRLLRILCLGLFLLLFLYDAFLATSSDCYRAILHL